MRKAALYGLIFCASLLMLGSKRMETIGVKSSRPRPVVLSRSDSTATEGYVVFQPPTNGDIPDGYRICNTDINSCVNAANGDSITLDSYYAMSVDANGAAEDTSAGSICNTDFTVIDIRFYPTFAHTDGVTRYLLDFDNGSGANRYAINKGADSILYFRAGNTVIFYILAANYASLWTVNTWHVLRMVADASGAAHEALLDGTSLTRTAESSFTKTTCTNTRVAAQNGFGYTYKGYIDYVRIYGGTSKANALANQQEGWEFNGGYTATVTATNDLTAQGTPVFVGGTGNFAIYYLNSTIAPVVIDINGYLTGLGTGKNVYWEGG